METVMPPSTGQPPDAPLPALVAHLADITDPGGGFQGYGRCACRDSFTYPHLALGEFCRLLEALIERGDEEDYAVIDARQVRVWGVDCDRLLTAELVTTIDGPRWLFDCGDWTFVERRGQDTP